MASEIAEGHPASGVGDPLPPSPYTTTTLVFDRENGRPLSPPKRQSVVVTPALAKIFVRAASLEYGKEPPLTFSTLLVAMLVDEVPWLQSHFEAQKVRIESILGKRKSEEPSLRSLNEFGLLDEYRTTESARAALEEAGRIARAASGSLTIDMRHLCAAYPILPNWHLKDFAEFNIDRLDWARAFGAEMARRFPSELAYWRGYADRASPVPLTSFSADVYTEEDLLGIDRSVDALALLIASTRTVTPLAIGVFGPWGSGKSFFMRHLQKRIVGICRSEQLAIEEWEAARKSGYARQEDTPLYFGEIAQVEFNAWHYNEENLVASLVEHIFRNLRVLPDEDDEQLEERRANVLRKLEGLTNDLATIDDAIVKAEKKIHDAEDEFELATKEAEDAKNDVGAKAREIEAQIKLSREKFETERTRFEEALRSINLQMGQVDPGAVVAVALEQFDPLVGNIREAIASVRAETLDWRGFCARLFTGKGVWAILLCLLAPFVLWFTNQLHDRWMALLGAGLPASAVLVKAFNVLKDFRTQFVAKLDKLEEEQRRRAKEERTRIEGQRSALAERAGEEIKRLTEALRAQQITLADREKVVNEAAKDLAIRAREHDEKLVQRVEAQQRVREAEAERKLLSSSSLLLDEFIKDRSSTDEYRSQLGFLALVRRDIERLSKLIDDANRRWLDGTNDSEHPPLNRIVLYIDDLDRCKESTVLAVLEAVHLLLAFPLFVCAVAVDPRWVEKCLRNANRQLFIDDEFEADVRDSNASATAGDYLEKIFQIPIWMSPIEGRTRAAVVNTLLGPTAAPAPRSVRVTQSRAAISRSAGGSTENNPFKALVDKARARPDPLRILPEEASYVETIAALLSERPRALKRFVNVYRLLKASLPDLDSESFISTDASSGYRICLSQLALFTGHPRLASPLVTALDRGYRGAYELDGTTLASETDESMTLGGWYNTLDPVGQSDVRSALQLIPNREILLLNEFRRWLPLTSRYLFHRAN